MLNPPHSTHPIPPLSTLSAHIRLLRIRLPEIPRLPLLRNRLVGLFPRIVAQHIDSDPQLPITRRRRREIEFVLVIRRDHILHVSRGVGGDRLTHVLTQVVQFRLFDPRRPVREGMIMDPAFLPVPVIQVLALVDLYAEVVAVVRGPADLLLLLHPAQALGRQVVGFGLRPGVVERFELAARAGPVEGVGSVGVEVVVVEAVVAAIVLSVDGGEVSGGRVDAVAFREAEDVAFALAVGAVVVFVV